jgi:hypothetical protein
MRACLALLFVTACTAETALPAALDAVPGPMLDRADVVDARFGNGPLYVVVLRDDALPVYGTPSVDGDVAGEIAADAEFVQGTGRVQPVHGTTWVEVQHGGVRGWAEGRFLSARVDAETFCDDRDVSDLFVDLELAIRERSDERLFGDISPAHGLYVQYRRSEPPIHMSDRDAAERMMSGEELVWGTGISGEPIVGSAEDLVLDELARGLAAQGATACNEIVSGATTYDVSLPAGFQNVNYYSVHLTGTSEYDWVTWVIGVEYVEGVPYLLSMHRFGWEP